MAVERFSDIFTRESKHTVYIFATDRSHICGPITILTEGVILWTDLYLVVRAICPSRNLDLDYSYNRLNEDMIIAVVIAI